MSYTVRLRGGFSDRNNIKKENTVMQLTDFDERARVEICNFVDIIFNVILDPSPDEQMQMLLKSILKDIYIQEVSFDQRYKSTAVLDIMKQTIREDQYDDILTILEYVVQKAQAILDEDIYCPECDLGEYLNDTFEKEYIGYRYVNRRIVPITNEHEIKEIKQAVNTEYQKVNKFIDKAIEKISDRKNPDYENSIKESISAVEEMCNIILGTAGTLGDALKKLEGAGVSIHPSLKSAFLKLYGYTSDESGIRHAGRIDGKNTTFAEAKFMLIVCSAFINYLIDTTKWC